MKHIHLFVIAALATMFMVSCGSDDGIISAGKIKSLVTEDLEKNQTNLQTGYLKIGYFESNNPEEIDFYKKLEKLGIVTCKIQNFQWYTKVTKKTWHHDYTTNYYYEGTNELAYSKPHYGDSPVVTNYIPDYHNMIKVQLTKKGQGMIFKPREEKSDEPEYKSKDFPMDSTCLFTPVEMKEAPALPEPEIVKEFIVDKRKPAAPKPEKEEAAPAPKPRKEVTKTPAVRYPLFECMDPVAQDAYNTAKENENYEIVTLVLYEYKVAEVKDRVIQKENGEIVSMTATAVLKKTDVTEATHLIALYNNNEIILNNQKTEKQIKLVNNKTAGEIDKEEWSLASEDASEYYTYPYANQ